MTNAKNVTLGDFVNDLVRTNTEAAFDSFINTLQQHCDYPSDSTKSIDFPLLDTLFVLYKQLPNFEEKHIAAVKYLLRPDRTNGGMDRETDLNSDEYRMMIGAGCCIHIAEKSPHYIDTALVNSLLNVTLDHAYKGDLFRTSCYALSQIAKQCPDHKDHIFETCLMTAGNAANGAHSRAWHLLAQFNHAEIMPLDAHLVTLATQEACLIQRGGAYNFLEHQCTKAGHAESPLNFTVIHAMIDTGFTNPRMRALELTAASINAISENNTTMLTPGLVNEFTQVAAHFIQVAEKKGPSNQRIHPARVGESDAIKKILQCIDSAHPNIIDTRDDAVLFANFRKSRSPA